jgi:hypothetical protein
MMKEQRLLAEIYNTLADQMSQLTDIIDEIKACTQSLEVNQQPRKKPARLRLVSQ